MDGRDCERELRELRRMRRELADIRWRVIEIGAAMTSLSSAMGCGEDGEGRYGNHLDGMIDKKNELMERARSLNATIGSILRALDGMEPKEREILIRVYIVGRRSAGERARAALEEYENKRSTG